MAYNPDIKYQTDGVVSILEAPDSTFDPTYSYVVGDEASADSWYGSALVKFFTWTPTESGTVYIAPPADDGEQGAMDFFVFDGAPGALIGASSATQVAESQFFFDDVGRALPLTIRSATFDAVAGTTYTLAAARYPASYDNVFTDALIPPFSLSSWILTTQPYGGQTPIVPWRPVASGLFACAEGYGTAASGNFSHAEGQVTIASNITSHAEGTGTVSSGFGSHAEGEGSVASGFGAHAEGKDTSASGSAAHAEGLHTTASSAQSHAEGARTTASGDNAHSEGNGTIASGLDSHAEGSRAQATAAYAHAEGQESLASHQSEHAHADGSFPTDSGAPTVGAAQYSRLVLHGLTTDATPSVGLNATNNLSVASGDSYAVDIQLIASRKDVAGTLASWHIRGLFTAAGGALRRIGTLDVLHHNDADASTWAADVVTSSADIAVQVTGENAKTIRWVATVHATKVGV